MVIVVVSMLIIRLYPLDLRIRVLNTRSPPIVKTRTHPHVHLSLRSLIHRSILPNKYPSYRTVDPAALAAGTGILVVLHYYTLDTDQMQAKNNQKIPKRPKNIERNIFFSLVNFHEGRPPPLTNLSAFQPRNFKASCFFYLPRTQLRLETKSAILTHTAQHFAQPHL